MDQNLKPKFQKNQNIFYDFYKTLFAVTIHEIKEKVVIKPLFHVSSFRH